MTQASTSARRWRVGLLATTLLTATALGATGFSGYLQARRNADILARAEIAGIVRSLRRDALRGRARSTPDEVIETFIEDASDEGLSYVGFVDSDGTPTKSFGHLRRPFDETLLSLAERWARRPPPFFGLHENAFQNMVTYDDGTIHAVFPVAQRRRALRHPMANTSSRAMLIEATSSERAQIISQALRALAIELGASLLLLGAAILFWRLSVKQEQLAAEMEADRLRMIAALEEDKRLKALGRMSAVLGHELKNPIAALKGHAQLLVEKITPDHDGRNQAETILSEALLLEHLTHGILEYVRTGALTSSKVYLDDLAYSAVALSNVDNVRLAVPEGQTWQLDRGRMEQVLVNLLTNARQSAPAESPIDLSMAILEDGDLEVVVRDRGDGIAASDLAHIFEPFFTRRTTGTGLGLPLAKRIVEGHGGTVTASNHPDGGAVFTLRMPRSRRAPEES